MARNAEKAMTALARFRQAQLEEGKVKERRPFLASECNELPKAEKWRRQIIGEISKKVAQIQNAGLGEFRIRDLNDEINKLLREKGHWEVRIKELGGPDYGKVGPKMLDHEGKEVPGNRGYKYFGAAKDLPGVRELFEKEPLPPPRKTRAELMKAIDAEYYGYRDEDDGILEPLEQEHEKKVIAEAVEKWKAEREARLARGDKEEEEEEINIYAVNDDESDEESAKEKEGEEGQQKFIAHVPVPSQQEMRKLRAGDLLPFSWLVNDGANPRAWTQDFSVHQALLHLSAASFTSPLNAALLKEVHPKIQVVKRGIGSSSIYSVHLCARNVPIMISSFLTMETDRGEVTCPGSHCRLRKLLYEERRWNSCKSTPVKHCLPRVRRQRGFLDFSF
ncbi:pre-mRNA-splicing factor ISY1 homolog isoform X1 [Macrotis lagotis]|uniref:pre-mRNA-splicing factor ISY1 homolog isoform X1 n=1 Tax=Macrotis lagotis TaxID=92651 RepID=UPI003D692056